MSFKFKVGDIVRWRDGRATMTGTIISRFTVLAENAYQIRVIDKKRSFQRYESQLTLIK